MNRQSLFFSTCLLLLLIFAIPRPSIAKGNAFGLNWQFAVNFPQSGVVGLLKGSIEHLQGTKFRFNGKYLNKNSPIKSGPIHITTDFNLDSGLLKLHNFSLRINRLQAKFPLLGLSNPTMIISGNRLIDPTSGATDFKNLRIKIGDLPELHTKLTYSPCKDGVCLLEVDDPLPLLEHMVELNFPDFEKWDRDGQFSLKIALRNIHSVPEADLKIDCKKLAATSADGMTLIEGMSGNIKANIFLNDPHPTLEINLKSGEALYDTFYVNLNDYPLEAKIKSSLPDMNGNLKLTATLNWQGMGNFNASAKLKDVFDTPTFSGNAEYKATELSAPFKTFAVEPFSLQGLEGSGKFSLLCNFNGTSRKTHLRGAISLEDGTLNKEEMKLSGIEAELPFVLSLNDKFLPQADINLPNASSGHISFKKIKSGKLEIKDFAFPVSISSNSIEFGDIPAINLEGGSLNLAGLKMRHPFNEDFVLNGEIFAKAINLLPLSPSSLPIQGQLSGDLKFWLLKDHLSTAGKLFGSVYGGEMTIDEIFAENPFEDSRQYGADFRVKHLDLEPLSKALDIGRITGRMDLDLNGLVIAYEQPAAFHLLAKTTPGSDSTREISLKAVNTLSVIGTGSGLTGTGVGVFSQFFKEFGYAGLGLECTLDDDLFKIRGLIRDDGIEYIIKRPPLFGINVINSNPENLISFSDMLKRLKRVIGD